jgi:hypothetical protein
MKKIYITISLLVIFTGVLHAQSLLATPDKKQPLLIAEASCGQCQFNMEGKGCDLAVRIDGKTYFVEGTTIDEHGDAHAADGFCEAIRKAEVQGEVIHEKFVVTYFRLLAGQNPEHNE